MIKIVAVGKTARNPAATRASVSASSAALGSSSTSTAGRRNSARASAIRCRSPADSASPRSPTGVSSPCGNRRSKSPSPAASAASAMAARGASATAKPMFSAIVALNRNGVWSISTTARRKSASARSRASTPPISTCPASGSRNRTTRSASVDLPAPLTPRIAAIAPAGTVKSTPASTASRSCRKCTPAKLIASGPAPSGCGDAGSATSGGVSNSSKMRPSDTRVDARPDDKPSNDWIGANSCD